MDVAVLKWSLCEDTLKLRNFWLSIGFAVVLVVMVYPFETTVVPQWKARVLDEEGEPIKMIGVREIWQHYSIEAMGHEEDSQTDESGYVVFPERKIRANLLIRIGRPLTKLISVHASSGPSAYLIALGDSSTITTHNIYTPGETPPAEVVLRATKK